MKSLQTLLNEYSKRTLSEETLAVLHNKNRLVHAFCRSGWIQDTDGMVLSRGVTSCAGMTAKVTRAGACILQLLNHLLVIHLTSKFLMLVVKFQALLPAEAHSIHETSSKDHTKFFGSSECDRCTGCSFLTLYMYASSASSLQQTFLGHLGSQYVFGQ